MSYRRMSLPVYHASLMLEEVVPVRLFRVASALPIPKMVILILQKEVTMQEVICLLEQIGKQVPDVVVVGNAQAISMLDFNFPSSRQ
jgi:hypothetical protein